VINKNFVFLSYGKKSEYLRAIGCILSFFAWAGDQATHIRIVIYTDDPDFFKIRLADLNIEYFILTVDSLDELKAGTEFIHRIKVGVIGLTLQHFPNEELVFIDSDTFFIADPKEILDELAPGTSFMHKREYNFTDGLALFSSFNQEHYPRLFIDYISGREFVIDGSPEIFSTSDYSWNSGVIGLPKDFGRYMPDVFMLTDAFYANSQWFISEQLAFSLILQRRTRIKPAENFVYHYWGKRQKILMDGLIEKLFLQYSPADLMDGKLMRLLTKKWHLTIEADLIEEQAKISFSRGNLKYGIKKRVQLFLLKTFKLQLRDGKTSFMK
jgi:hypothetical protein